MCVSPFRCGLFVARSSQCCCLVAFTHTTVVLCRPFGVSTAIRAEPPSKDWEAELKKLETEAEERMDAKAAELKATIESTGK